MNYGEELGKEAVKRLEPLIVRWRLKKTRNIPWTDVENIRVNYVNRISLDWDQAIAIWWVAYMKLFS